MITWILALVTVIGSLLYIFKDWTCHSSPIPGPICWPVVGNYFQFCGGNQIQILQQWRKKYGPVFQYHLFSTPFLVVSGKEVLKEVMVEKGDAFAGRVPWKGIRKPMPFKDIVDEANSPFWKTMRLRTLQALKLYGNGMSKFEKRMEDLLLDIVTEIRTKEGVPHDYYEDIYKFTGAFIGSTITGEDLNLNDPLTLGIMEHIGETPRHVGSPNFNTQLYMAAPWLKHINNKTDQMRRKLRDGSIRLWDEFFKSMKEGFDLDSDKKQDGLLYILAKQQQEQKINQEVSGGSDPFCDGTMRVVVTNIIIAGTLTTTTTLYLFLNILLHHPAVQEKIAEEAERVLGDQMVSVHDKSRMPYTYASLLEVLRYTTIIPNVIPHMTTKDTEVGGYKVSKGTPVLPYVVGSHMDDQYWNEPKCFNPERFLDSDGKILPPDHPTRTQAVPFGAGPRVCLGKQLAVNRLFMLIVTLNQNFTFNSPDGTKLVSYRSADYGHTTIDNPPRYKMVVKPRTLSNSTL